MADEELVDLIRENERYKAALRAILIQCQTSAFGAWRHFIGRIAADALGIPVKGAPHD